MRIRLLFYVLLVAQNLLAQFAPGAGQPGSTAVPVDEPTILGWGSPPLLARGPQQIDSTHLGLASFGTPLEAAGQADFLVVSLGENGTATYDFSPAIGDGPGWDLAIFENGFPSGQAYFLELAYVEVSTDGQHFVRFPATSLTSTLEQIGTFDLLDPTQLNNLAGKYEGGFGTPFDLAELADSNGLDIQHISHVRIRDVVGQLDNSGQDQSNNPINDPWPTPFESSGFDLDALAYRYLGTTATEELTNGLTDVSVYPNPVQAGQSIRISQSLISTLSEHETLHFRWLDAQGVLVSHERGLNFSRLKAPERAGVYFLSVEGSVRWQPVRVVVD